MSRYLIVFERPDASNRPYYMSGLPPHESFTEARGHAWTGTKGEAKERAEVLSRRGYALRIEEAK